jgi:CheY-like chemotaxis protein
VAQISILTVGNTRRPEFREARSSLEALGRVIWAEDAPSAASRLATEGAPPDLIVVAQAYPGQFAAESIDRLRRLAPLARVIGLLGSWCEGEVRTGEPWPGVIRVYWHQWLPRAEQEIARLRHGSCSTWALPVTASEEERLLLLAEQPAPRREGLIAISAAQFEMQDWLSAACTARGYSTVWLRPHRPLRVEGLAAAIFDGDQCRGDEVQSLRDLAAALRPVPIIALLDFPRVEDRDRALAAGARAVLSKPLLVEDLFWHIERLVGDRPP